MNRTGVLKVYLIGTRTYACRRNFRRVGHYGDEFYWVTTAMNSIGEARRRYEVLNGARMSGKAEKSNMRTSVGDYRNEVR